MKNVKFLKMLAEELRFPDGFFDVVVSNCGIDFARFSQCVKEISRVLRPGGVFAFDDWHLIDVKPHRIFEEILGRHRTATPSPQLARERAALATSLDRGSVLMNPARLNFKDIRLIGAWYAPTQQYGKDLDFITSRKFRFEKLVTHKFKIDDAQKAIEIHRKLESMKAVVIP